MRVSDWIRDHPGRVVTVPGDLSLEALLERVLEEPQPHDLYVVDTTGALVGHISRGQVARLVLASHQPVHTRRQIVQRVAPGSARELMHRHFPRARPDEELDSVLHRQLDQDIEDMPVVAEDGTPIGAVSLAEVLRAVRDGRLT